MTYGLMTNGWISLPVTQTTTRTVTPVKPRRVQVIAEPTTVVKLQVNPPEPSTDDDCTE